MIWLKIGGRRGVVMHTLLDGIVSHHSDLVKYWNDSCEQCRMWLRKESKLNTVFSCISSILLSFRLCFSSPTSSQTMSDHSPWGLVPWLEGQTALPLQAEGSAGSPGLWPTNHPDQEGAGRGEATGEASDLQFRCFFISFSDFPVSGCVWMIFAMFWSVWA